MWIQCGLVCPVGDSREERALAVGAVGLDMGLEQEHGCVLGHNLPRIGHCALGRWMEYQILVCSNIAYVRTLERMVTHAWIQMVKKRQLVVLNVECHRWVQYMVNIELGQPLSWSWGFNSSHQDFARDCHPCTSTPESS